MNQAYPPAQGKGKTVVYGSFKGMGDLLAAAPVIASELNAGNQVKLLLFPGQALQDFLQLIDFGPNRANLHPCILPVSGRPEDFKKFFSQMSRFSTDLIWISPHAPRPASSWKLPVLLWLVKKLYWPKAQLAGAESEHCSFLFDMRVPVDRRLPLAQRERTAYAMIENKEVSSLSSCVSFTEEIQRARSETPEYDLLIHPGANANNRIWPFTNYASLIRQLPLEYKIAVVGLPRDVECMQQQLPKDRDIRFLTGSLKEAIVAIARAHVVLSMDSGNVHFANFMNVPVVALFGKSDPASTVSAGGSILPIYEQKHACQPCGKATCSQKEVYCMTTIAPETVAKAVLTLLKDSRPESLSSPPVAGA